MADTKGAQGGAMDIEISDSVAEGRYANLAIISHSTSEFILDFAVHLPGLSKAKVHSRVILTPEHAKRLLYSLQENINRYESKHGSISMPQERMSPQEIITSKLGKA
ncbi:MAG: DUF3467 domain-containing protein [Rikenellaceae bacterium]